jgi:hypothetical protein
MLYNLLDAVPQTVSQQPQPQTQPSQQSQQQTQQQQPGGPSMQQLPAMLPNPLFDSDEGETAEEQQQPIVPGRNPQRTRNAPAIPHDKYLKGLRGSTRHVNFRLQGSPQSP